MEKYILANAELSIFALISSALITRTLSLLYHQIPRKSSERNQKISIMRNKVVLWSRAMQWSTVKKQNGVVKKNALVERMTIVEEKCCSVLKSNDGKNSRVQFKATRHVKKQKSVVDFFFIRSTHNFDFWAKSQVYVFQ